MEELRRLSAINYGKLTETSLRPSWNYTRHARGSVTVGQREGDV